MGTSTPPGALSTPPRGAGGPRPRQGPRTRPRSGTGCPAPPRKQVYCFTH